MKYAARLKFIADESFDEGTHIDRLLRSEKVAQDVQRTRRAGASGEQIQKRPGNVRALLFQMQV